MITLYIETNFFIDFAKNQDQETENLVYSQNPEVTTRLKIITPAICCMEALSVLESERNRSNRFGDNLKDEVRKLKGDVNSQYSREIKRCLEQAIIKNNERINEINTRLFDILEWAKNSVELIQLKPDILSASLDNLLITDLPSSKRTILNKLSGLNILREPSTYKNPVINKDCPVPLLERISTPAAAKWACNTAAKTVQDIVNKMPNSEFKDYLKRNYTNKYFQLIED